jgi:hypothetical protein
MFFMGMVTAVCRSVVGLCNPEFEFEQVYRDLADVRFAPSEPHWGGDRENHA